jgi:hypothetical protein
MSEEQETYPLEIGLGSYIGLKKGATLVTGLVNGIKPTASSKRYL